MTDAAQEHTAKRGLVKQVLSGDSIVLQGPAVNGPPKEITVYLSNVTAPRLARRPTEGKSEGTSDEPYAWEAREFLRKKIVGKTVVFIRDFITTSQREHGRVYLGGSSPEDAENVAESGVKAGWLEVRPGKQADEYTQKLLDAQEQAKSEKAGRWAEDGKAQEHVRNITWQVEDPRALVDAYKGKAIDAVVEQVRDGSTVRAFLLPSFEYVTVMFSGVKAPQAKTNPNAKVEEYGEEARYFVESRLLQRDVKLHLEGVSNQNFVGSVIHPRGNIAEFLLQEGLAKCIEWTLSLVTGGPLKLREAERQAKSKKLRIWRNYVSTALAASDRKSYNVKVIEVGLGDSLTVLKENGEEAKIYFSSLRAPRREGAGGAEPANRKFLPLYDIPYMFEAREFLRKRLIGKRVQLTLDYIQPKQEQFPEKACFTVTFNGQNIGEQLIANGLAKAARHKQDDENRSSQYDALLAAEAAAEQAKKGVWAERTADKNGTVRIHELQGDLNRSKQFLPSLQRGSRPTGIVEFVASGSRLRVYIPKEAVVITFLLSGINCPRNARVGPGGKISGESEPFADEAHKFVRHLVLQHEVQMEVETLDKQGGFIGYLFVKNDKGGFSNLAELLVEQGLASVHFTAERSRYYNQLQAAEESAKARKLNRWANYVEEEPEEKPQDQAADASERKLNLKKVVVSDVGKGNLHFAVQQFADGPAIEKIMGDLQRELGSPDVATSHTPKRGDLVAAVFKEVNMWHRARVESVKNGCADILYIDFGNRENVPLSRLAPLPVQFVAQPPLCKEYKLALVSPPNDPDFAAESDEAFGALAQKAPFLELNPEYKEKTSNLEACTLYFQGPDGKPTDLGKYLVEQGLALAENRREQRFKNLVNDYQQAEETARRERRNIWRYGDFTGQDF